MEALRKARKIGKEEIEKAEQETQAILKRSDTTSIKIPRPKDTTVTPVDKATCCVCGKFGHCFEVIMPAPEEGQRDVIYPCEKCYFILLKEGRLNLKMEKSKDQFTKTKFIITTANTKDSDIEIT